MKVCEANFDALDFFDASIGNPVVWDTNIVAITVKNLGLLPDDALHVSSPLVVIDACELVFEGVVRSERTIHEYVGDPRQGEFQPARTMSDGPFPPHGRETKTFAFEGQLETPLAWIESWVIHAERCLLKIPAAYASSESPTTPPGSL
jgi:hypothetical protein